jgi:hypothetical protein
MNAMAAEPGQIPVTRLDRDLDEFEEAFERESLIEQQRREDLRKRAVNRSRARKIVKTERHGRVRFSVLLLAMSATVVTVVIVMFEVLAWLVGG